MKREFKRLLLPILFLIITGFFMDIFDKDSFFFFFRKVLNISFVVIFVHLLRKMMFYYVDIEKHFEEAYNTNKAIAFLGISIIIGLFILGVFICFGSLL